MQDLSQSINQNILRLIQENEQLNSKLNALKAEEHS